MTEAFRKYIWKGTGTLADDKKGITVKIDAGLHAEVRQYIEQHSMTMAEFITLALDDELHPKFNQKEGSNMENMRTLAFQVPEDLFQRIKDYLHRNNMSQKEFVIGLIEDELEREQAEREGLESDDVQDDTFSDGFEAEPEEYENSESDDEETEDEEEAEGMTMGM